MNVVRHHMKQLLVILLGLTVSVNLFGQIEKEIETILETKNFKSFEDFSNNLVNKNLRVSSHWHFLRDLTNDFREGVFIFNKSVPDKADTLKNIIYRYQINLISTTNQIIFYELMEKKFKNNADKQEPYFQSIKKYKDSLYFDSLNSSFKTTYGLALNETDLFITNLIYGDVCGILGVETYGRKIINDWVKKQDKPSLLNWLRCANTEKQLYAIGGILQLEEVGIILTFQEKSIINFILKKKGTVYSCSDCLYGSEEIHTFSKYFKF